MLLLHLNLLFWQKNNFLMYVPRTIIKLFKITVIENRSISITRNAKLATRFFIFPQDSRVKRGKIETLLSRVPGMTILSPVDSLVEPIIKAANVRNPWAEARTNCIHQRLGKIDVRATSFVLRPLLHRVICIPDGWAHQCLLADVLGMCGYIRRINATRRSGWEEPWPRPHASWQWNFPDEPLEPVNLRSVSLVAVAKKRNIARQRERDRENFEGEYIRDRVTAGNNAVDTRHSTIRLVKSISRSQFSFLDDRFGPRLQRSTV